MTHDYALTQGGRLAHIVRRMIHLSIILVPLLYYYFLPRFFSQSLLNIAVILFLFLVILFEIIRVRLGVILFAQRLHEATHFSAFGWTMLSLGLILLFSPSVAFSLAIIISCALVDPLLGELRALKINQWKIVSVGLSVVLLIWLAIAYFYSIAYGWAFLMAPIIIAVEWPSFKWIDDNALMMLVPLGIILLVSTQSII
jgi:hypothetical protein